MCIRIYIFLIKEKKQQLEDERQKKKNKKIKKKREYLSKIQRDTITSFVRICSVYFFTWSSREFFMVAHMILVVQLNSYILVVFGCSYVVYVQPQKSQYLL